MKILNIFSKKPRRRFVSDFYQNSIEKTGRDQFKKLIEKGLSIPVVVL